MSRNSMAPRMVPKCEPKEVRYTDADFLSALCRLDSEARRHELKKFIEEQEAELEAEEEQ